MVNAKDEYKKQTTQAAFAVAFYMIVSIGLVFLNRLVLTNKTEKAGGLFISWYQFVVAYFIMIFISVFCQKVPVLNIFPPIKYKMSVMIKIVPVSVCYLLMIGFNNKCLEYVSVSGYQIVRSLTIIFNIILSYLLLKEKTSIRAILACIGVLIGFVLGIEGEINLSTIGVVFGVLSSIFLALYSILVKWSLDLVDGNQYVLMEYNTLVAIVLMFPFVYFNDEFDVFTPMRSKKFWGMQTLAGVTGFVINIAIFLSIKYTTPLTHNLSGTVKACLQTFLAFLLFDGETMGFLKFVGTVLVISFSAYYSHVRKAEMKQSIEEKAKNSSNQKTDIEKPLFEQAQEEDESA